MATSICIINPEQNNCVSVPSFTARHSGNTATQDCCNAAFVLSHLSVLAAPQGLIIHYKRPMIWLLVTLVLSQRWHYCCTLWAFIMSKKVWKTLFNCLEEELRFKLIQKDCRSQLLHQENQFLQTYHEYISFGWFLSCGCGVHDSYFCKYPWPENLKLLPSTVRAEIQVFNCNACSLKSFSLE